MRHFDDYHAHSGPTIVLLHGGGLSRKSWQPVADALPGFHILVPDLSGHGERASERFTLDGAAQDTAALIREHAPEGRAHVVGLSLGGAVALTLARLCPELLASVMVTGTAAGLNKVMAHIALDSTLMLPLIPRGAMARMSIKQFGIPGEYRALVEDDLRATATDLRLNRRMIEELARMTLPETMPAPLLITVGEKETGTAKAAARTLAKRYPQAAARIVPGLGHVWSLQNPALFAETLRAWVAGAPLPAELRPLDVMRQEAA